MKKVLLKDIILTIVMLAVLLFVWKFNLVYFFVYDAEIELINLVFTIVYILVSMVFMFTVSTKIAEFYRGFWIVQLLYGGVILINSLFSLRGFFIEILGIFSIIIEPPLYGISYLSDVLLRTNTDILTGVLYITVSILVIGTSEYRYKRIKLEQSKAL